MGNGDDSEKPNLSDAQRLSEIETEVRAYVAKIKAIEESLTLQQQRTKWLTEREASKVDHVTQLATSVSQDRAAKDRNTEALLVAIQRLGDVADMFEWVQGALREISAKIAAQDTSDLDDDKNGGGDTKKLALGGVREPTPLPLPPPPPLPPGMVPLHTLESVVESYREASGVQRTHRRESAPGLVESADSWRTIIVVAVRRTIRDFLRAPSAAQFWLFATVVAIGFTIIAYVAITRGWRLQQLEQRAVPAQELPSVK